MIVHTLRFSFKDDVGEAERERFLSGMRRFGELDSVQFCVVGPDLGGDGDGFTHGYCAGWEDLDALERFLYSPTHRELGAASAAMVSKVAAFDFSDDGDPTLGRRFQELNQRFAESFS